AGVVAVLTSEDIAGSVQQIPSLVMEGWPLDEIRPVKHPVLATSKVCYVGQPVAIVVAEDPYVARDAVELIQVDYDPLPLVLDPFAALQPEAPLIHPEIGTNLGMRISPVGRELT